MKLIKILPLFILISLFAKRSSAFQIMSLNLYNRPWNRIARLESAAKTIQKFNPDILALQEVAEGWFLPQNPLYFFIPLFHPSNFVRNWHETNFGIFKTGLAIITRYDIIGREYFDFDSHEIWDTKGFQKTLIKMGDKKIQVINVHFSSTKKESIRISQFTELRDYILNHSEDPTLVLGDFNAEPDSNSFINFIKETEAIASFTHFKEPSKIKTWSNKDEEEWIDHMLLIPSSDGRNFIFKETKVIPSEFLPAPSDHVLISSVIQ